MRTSNIANEAVRQAECGHVWEEMLSGAQGTIEVARYATFRVRASAGTTVTIGGILAMTMAANEVAIFNAGFGDPAATNITTVPVVIAGANAWVQVARDNKRTI